MIKISQQAISSPQLAALFENSGIHRPVQDFGRMQRMLNNANVLFTAWDGTKLVGVLRGMSDMSYCTYVSDLAVARDYQKSGIGKALLDALKQSLGPNISIVLLAAPTAMAYYPKVGFEPVPTGFKRQRQY